MLSIAINRAEHVCDTVIIKHNYMLMCNHKIVINIMLCLLNSTGQAADIRQLGPRYEGQLTRMAEPNPILSAPSYALTTSQFIIELNNLNIYEHLNQNIDSSPQANYEIFSKFVKRAKDMCLPKRKVKYIKKRHMKSSWMTRGILNSTNTKNMLYKIFIQADSQNVDTYNNFKLEHINV